MLLEVDAGNNAGITAVAVLAVFAAFIIGETARKDHSAEILLGGSAAGGEGRLDAAGDALGVGDLGFGLHGNVGMSLYLRYFFGDQLFAVAHVGEEGTVFFYMASQFLFLFGDNHVIAGSCDIKGSLHTCETSANNQNVLINHINNPFPCVS
ncbi:hypothetical protein SDC9_115714 [bioreactor metagenome]|uniref:Uncharacterized protein n=1 Tax=bioreactor metagenome TaxID=1076179 RepID=A0A645BTN5_9ZZZZ